MEHAAPPPPRPPTSFGPLVISSPHEMNESIGWKCASCQFDNNPLVSRCAICDTPKPANILKHSSSSNNNTKCKEIKHFGETGIFLIRQNNSGQFKLENNNGSCTEYNIDKLFPSFKYNIYAENGYENIWSAGCNDFGQCAVGNFEKNINPFHPILYFQQNGIKIRKICVNIHGGYHSFFISDHNELYGVGRNEDGEMGLNEEEQNKMDPSQRNKNEPIHIAEISDIIDAIPGYQWSVVLSGSIKKEVLLVVANWSRAHNLTKQIVNTILSFIRINTVYYTKDRVIKERKDKDLKLINNKYKWHKMNRFEDKHIVKMAVGRDRVLFLENTGMIWSFGLGLNVGIIYTYNMYQ